MRTGGGRWLLAVPRALRADLWTTARNPLPPRPSRRLAWLPHVVVTGLATLAFLFMAGLVYGPIAAWPTLVTGPIGPAAVVLALRRPVLAWWVVTAGLVAGAWSAGPPFPWGFPAILPLAGVLFLLALRVRARVVVEALTLSVLAALASVGFQVGTHTDAGWAGLVLDTEIGRALLVLVLASGFGVLRRARRVAAARLHAQKSVAAGERARRTVLEERGRIARELHDVVAHHLSVISIQAQVAPHLVDDPPAALTENLTGIRQNALDALTELRRVLGVLRLEGSRAEQAPQPTLDQLGEVVGKVRAAGVAVALETVGERRPLSPGVELSAFRLVQEALSNAMRHAPGAAVRVEISYLPTSVRVLVRNDAPAHPAPPPSEAGHGLLGMRERTTMLGGSLAAGPTPEGGYDVTAILPAPAGARR